jgi:hypothetical protein
LRDACAGRLPARNSHRTRNLVVGPHGLRMSDFIGSLACEDGIYLGSATEMNSV